MIPEDVKLAAGAVVLPLVNKLTVAEADALFTDIINVIMSDRASRLPRQEDETRRAALEEATASARFARLMEIVCRIIWTDLGQPSMGNPRTQTALMELSEFVLQDALERAYRTRALSQKGDEADG